MKYWSWTWQKKSWEFQDVDSN